MAKTPIDHDMIAMALKEDMPAGDITTEATVSAESRCVAQTLAKQDFTLAGIELFASVFRHLDPKIRVSRKFADGDLVPKGAEIAVIKGSTRGILTAERVALNFLQHLSGIATLTNEFVNLVAGTGAIILDTRKTTPCLRDLEKYAVRCGGGENHRRDLSCMALIKENHIASAGGIARAVRMVRNDLGRKRFIEVETQNLKEVKEALICNVNRIMFDNMTLPQAIKAVALVDGKAETEVSGNINLNNVRSFAKTGVNYISIGSLTHSPPAVDISLIIENQTNRKLV